MPKISELTTTSTITDDDYLVLVDSPGGTAATKKITAANAATYFSAAASFGSRYNVVTPTGVAATDTAAIQAAMDDVAPANEDATSGAVFLSAGDYSINAGLVRPHRVAVIGSGPGCRLLLASAFPADTPVFRNENENTAARGEMGFYYGFTIDGAANANSGVNGIEETHDWTEGDAGEEWVDQRSVASHIGIFNLSGSGIIESGRGVNDWSHIQIFNCGGWGMELDIDSHVSDCDVGSCGTGGYILGGNTQISNCKAWFCGYYNGSMVANHAAGEGVGFLFDSNYSGCVGANLYAQDCARNGIRFLDSGRVTIAGAMVDSCNNSGAATDYAGVEWNNSYGACVQDLHVFDRATNPTNQISGLSFLASSSYNIVSGFIETGADLINIFTSGTSIPGNDVRIYGTGVYFVETGASSITPSLANGSVQRIPLVTNTTIAAPTDAYAGIHLTLIFVQTTGTTNTVTLNSVFKKAGGAFTASTGTGAVSTLTFVYDGTDWKEIGRALAVA